MEICCSDEKVQIIYVIYIVYPHFSFPLREQNEWQKWVGTKIITYNIYFWLRFGLANAINDYLRL